MPDGENRHGDDNLLKPTRDQQGRWLPGVMPEGANRFPPGVSGNPGGKLGQYHDAMKLARSKSVAAVQRMVELAELDNVDQDGKLAPLSRRTDARVAAHATEWLWSIAWGKTQPKALDEAPGVTIEQRRDEAMATLQAAFERVLQASKAQAAREAAEPSTAVVVTIDQK